MRGGEQRLRHFAGDLSSCGTQRDALHRSPLGEIRQGGDDDSEMGVYHDLYQFHRESNLRLRLEEYLRFGLEAGIIYAT